MNENLVTRKELAEMIEKSKYIKIGVVYHLPNAPEKYHRKRFVYLTISKQDTLELIGKASPGDRWDTELTISGFLWIN